MQSEIRNPKVKIVIAGAGPAGTSAAIRLAQRGFRVVLIEREKFPRHKLCGEFISPECFAHFKELNVLDKMLLAGGEPITETVFYAPNGKSVGVPSRWFNRDESALSLSRAEMDFRLLERAKEIGVEVFEETSVVGLLFETGAVCGVKVKNSAGEIKEITADLTIDATGRARILGKLAEREQLRITNYELRKVTIQNPKSKIQNRLVGFKTHLRDTEIGRGRCEIYFFRGGYGGLSAVENGVSNHCFLIRAEVVKEFNGDAERIVREVVFQNKRAKETMQNAAPVFDWLAVSVDGFGVKDLNPAARLLAIGDAGAFIDPFTGSGMLMALESAEILAESITQNEFSFSQIAENYRKLHTRKFQKRLRVCALMRRAAFVPNLTTTIISLLKLSEIPIRFLAKNTRSATAASAK